MRVTEAIREVMSLAGMSSRQVSQGIGRTDNYVTSVVRQAERMNADMNTSTVAVIGSACGYTLALVPDGELPPGAIPIDPPSSEG